MICRSGSCVCPTGKLINSSVDEMKLYGFLSLDAVSSHPLYHLLSAAVGGWGYSSSASV